MEKYITFKCLEVVQPIGIFYIGVINHRDLLKISYADIRRIEERDFESYLGIQRPLDDKRVEELKKYVLFVDATFPTSIILTVKSKDAYFNADTSELNILDKDNVAKIIDGQHRIAGLVGYNGPQFQLNVTIFIDMDIEDQAMVFTTINLKQTKVNKSLSYDLYEYTKSRSPQKTGHNIAIFLNRKNGSPFEGKIKILGISMKGIDSTISQATFIDRLIPYISEDYITDRDILKRGLKLKKIDEIESRKLIFRNLFIDSKDAEITMILWNYFSAIKVKWPSAWNKNETGIILNRTTGFGAFMKFLKPVYLYLLEKGGLNSEKVLDILDKIDLSDEDFNSKKYVPGGSGETSLYKDLIIKSDLPTNM